MINYTCRVFKIILASLAVIVLSSCSKGQNPGLVDVGIMKSGIYINKFFGINITKPTKWYVHSNKAGKSKLKHKNYNAEKYFFFAWFQKPVNDKSNQGFNSNILGVAERVLMSSGVKTESQYLLSIKALMKKSAVRYNFTPNIKLVKLGQRDFSMIEVESIIAGQTIKVRYYTYIKNHYAFSIIASWQTEEQFKLIKRVLSSVTFNK